MGSTWIIQSTIKVRDLVKEELATSVPQSVWDSSSWGWGCLQLCLSQADDFWILHTVLKFLPSFFRKATIFYFLKVMTLLFLLVVLFTLSQ